MKKYLEDRDETLKNREKLFNNLNQLNWYKKLYSLILKNYLPLSEKKILEIGSGSSPLKYFYPEVITSDILELDYLDLKFNCQKIDEVHEITNGSLDIICMTNVLHHLEKPVDFLNKASLKLKEGGDIILVEPFFSWISTPIYKFIHHEFCDFNISNPKLKNIEGPLSSANMSLPYLIFFSSKGWDSELKKIFVFSKEEIKYYSSLSYFATGGFRRPIHIPKLLYNLLLQTDCLCARLLPKIFASFFIFKLKKNVYDIRDLNF
jgi:SAM-dependent methyltransferase